MYDFLIVGSGFFGATAARLLTDAGNTCLVIDRLPHIAGAAHDSRWDNGVMVSSYGGHILHSNSSEIWNFLGQFSELMPFINKPKVISGSNVYSFPINMMTLHQLWGVITPEEARQKLNAVRLPCENPRNFEEWALDKIGQELYETFIYGYTKKQWMCEPRELPISIIRRLPIRLTYDENYFTALHQGIPAEGYTKLVENMLAGITVELGVDFFSIRDKWQMMAKHLIYTGPLDRFFDYSLGKLDYNTLRFEHKALTGDFQGTAVFNYTDEKIPYLRTVEHKHFYRKNTVKHDTLAVNKEPTVVSYDYPVSFQENPEPYYPIRDEKNSLLYEEYAKLLRSHPNISVGGRLGSYTYCDIDQTVAQAMTLVRKFC